MVVLVAHHRVMPMVLAQELLEVFEEGAYVVEPLLREGVVPSGGEASTREHLQSENSVSVLIMHGEVIQASALHDFVKSQLLPVSRVELIQEVLHEPAYLVFGGHPEEVPHIRLPHPEVLQDFSRPEQEKQKRDEPWPVITHLVPPFWQAGERTGHHPLRGASAP